MTPTARRTVMRELFSRQGIDLSLMRVPMGASDFSATGIPYTYDDLAPGQTDPGLQHFSVAHDDGYILPALRQMLAWRRLVPLRPASAAPLSPSPGNSHPKRP